MPGSRQPVEEKMKIYEPPITGTYEKGVGGGFFVDDIFDQPGVVQCFEIEDVSIIKPGKRQPVRFIAGGIHEVIVTFTIFTRKLVINNRHLLSGRINNDDLMVQPVDGYSQT
jgi:hypothetical protein